MTFPFLMPISILKTKNLSKEQRADLLIKCIANVVWRRRR